MGHDDIKRANLNMIMARKQCKGAGHSDMGHSDMGHADMGHAAPAHGQEHMDMLREHDDAENREGQMPDEDDSFQDVNL